MEKIKITNIFKGTLFGLFWLFVGIAIYVLVYSFFITLISDLAFGTGILAIATIILAFFTYWNIRSRSAQENRDRKERLLNEVIDWVEDVAKLNFKIYDLIEAQISKEPWVESSIGEIVSQFQVIEAKGFYIIAITSSSFKGKRKLISTVKAVNKEIRELVDVSVKRLDKKVGSEIMKEHMDSLRMKVRDLLEEAAKIKARDTS